MRIQDELQLSYLFISHDLSMVRHIADEIAVMYLGRVVESGRYDQVFASPAHPYTRALADAIPLPDPAHERARAATSSAQQEGEVSAGGCAYAPRCAMAEDACRTAVPELVETTQGHRVACVVAVRASSS